MSETMSATLMRLIVEVENLEERLDELDLEKAPAEEREAVRRQLDEKQRELQRVSDGCGRPRNP